MGGWVYILECCDGSYYTGSTTNLTLRLKQHQEGIGAKHTQIRLPVKLVYSEAFARIDKAFKREKQIQKWTKAKKEALIAGNIKKLKELASCKNETHYLKSKKLNAERSSLNKQEDKGE